MSSIATRDAYGKALVKLGQINEQVVVLDADLSKSTKTNDFYKAYPDMPGMGIAPLFHPQWGSVETLNNRACLHLQVPLLSQ